jgi:hypothetical protein
MESCGGTGLTIGLVGLVIAMLFSVTPVIQRKTSPVSRAVERSIRACCAFLFIACVTAIVIAITTEI